MKDTVKETDIGIMEPGRPTTSCIRVLDRSYDQLLEDATLLSSFNNLFKNVLGGKPWNRWKTCIACGNYTIGKSEYNRLEQSSHLQHCGQDLVDFYTPDSIVDLLRQDLTVPNTKPDLFLAIEERVGLPHDVVGFMWGYSDGFDVVFTQVMDKYFGNLETNKKNSVVERIRENLKTQTPKTKTQELSFISMLGISDDRRGDSRILAGILHAATLKHSHLSRKYFFRTSLESPMRKIGLLIQASDTYYYSEDFADPLLQPWLFMAGDIPVLKDILETYPDERFGFYLQNHRHLLRQKRAQNS